MPLTRILIDLCLIVKNNFLLVAFKWTLFSTRLTLVQWLFVCSAVDTHRTLLWKHLPIPGLISDSSSQSWEWLNQKVMPKFLTHINSHTSWNLTWFHVCFMLQKWFQDFAAKNLIRSGFSHSFFWGSMSSKQAFPLLFPRKSPARAQTYAPRSVFYGLLS